MPGASRSPVARALPVAPALAASAVFGTLWVPWVQTGTTRRSAFRVVSALRGAGLLHRTPAEAFFAVVATLPGVVAATWVLWLTRYRRASAISAAAAGVLALAATAGVRDVAHHRAAGTLVLTTAAGAAAVVTGVAALLSSPPDAERL